MEVFVEVNCISSYRACVHGGDSLRWAGRHVLVVLQVRWMEVASWILRGVLHSAYSMQLEIA